MIRQEEYLTLLEMIHTYGFIKMMSLIWGTVLLIGLPIWYLLKQSKITS